MNKTTIIIIAIILLVIGGLGIYFFTMNEDEPTSSELPVNENIDHLGEGDDEIIEEVSDSLDEDTEKDMDDEDEPIVLEETAAGVYKEYNSSLIGEGRNVIFFHAGWCPTCKVLDDDIEENADDIPADVVILKADFDSEKELRNKYNVNVQHTLVVVDDQGNEVDTFVGSRSLKQVLSSI